MKFFDIIVSNEGEMLFNGLCLSIYNFICILDSVFIVVEKKDFVLTWNRMSKKKRTEDSKNILSLVKLLLTWKKRSNIHSSDKRLESYVHELLNTNVNVFRNMGFFVCWKFLALIAASSVALSLSQ